MSNSYFLKDNIPGNIAEADVPLLDCIANKSILELQREYPKLFVYRNSFDDRIEKESIFQLLENGNIYPNNIVGFISVNGIKINIGSRFSESTGKQFFIQYMLQKIHKLNLIEFKTSHNNTNIWEQLLYLIFPVFLKNAYLQGIFKIYQKREFNDSNIKGRIDIARHIKQNIPFLGKVAYNNRELCTNNHINQLIRHTIEFVSSKGFSSILYNDQIINKAVQIIKNITPDYNLRDRQKLILKNIKNVKHPYFTEYDPLKKLCLQILKFEGLSFDENKNNVYGLLIDAAWLWEEYLNSILKDLEFKHPENKTGKGALKLFAEYNNIYPDFYNTDKKIVVDAKYKMLEENDVSREDMYQIITYMYRLRALKGITLFPSFKESIHVRKMHIDSYGCDEAKFIKYGMSVPKETDNYQNFRQCFKESEQELKNYMQSLFN